MIYILTQGEFSSYEILDIYEGPDDFDQAAAKKEWDEAIRIERASPWKMGMNPNPPIRNGEIIIKGWFENHGFKRLGWREIHAGDE